MAGWLVTQMPNSNRRRGDYFERRTRAALEAQDWLVTRSAGSLGVADLVALRGGRTPLLVSCKLDGRLPRKEREALIAAADWAGADAILAHRGPRPGQKLRPGWVALEHVTGAGILPLPPLYCPPRGPK